MCKSKSEEIVKFRSKFTFKNERLSQTCKLHSPHFALSAAGEPVKEKRKYSVLTDEKSKEM